MFIVIIVSRVNAKIVINSRTAKVDGTGNWKLETVINIPYDAAFGKYSITVSDGRNQSLQKIYKKNKKSVLQQCTLLDKMLHQWRQNLIS